jgi:hypothetical protein
MVLEVLLRFSRTTLVVASVRMSFLSVYEVPLALGRSLLPLA